MTYEKEKYLKFLQGIFNITPEKGRKVYEVFFGRRNMGGKIKNR